MSPEICKHISCLFSGNSDTEVVYAEVKVQRNMKKTRPNSHVPLND